MIQQLDQLADQNSGLSETWNRQHDVHVIRKLLELIQGRVSPGTWRIFKRQMIDGASPEDVATELNVSLDSVYAAKSRMLKMLRQEAKGLID